MFEQAFSAVPHTICYALKANSSLALIELLAARGAGFDIVSGGELARVQHAAPSAPGRTVFAGVGKQQSEIDDALRADILLFNVESEAELSMIAARAEALGIRARVSLRVNPDVAVDTHRHISTGESAHKFGIDLGQARRVYSLAAASPWLDAIGVSVHIGSQIRDPHPFAEALQRVSHLISELRDDGIGLTHIDAGGGLGIEYGDAAFEPAAAVAEYARLVIEATQHLGMHLLLEPGRFLVAQAGALLTRVILTKQTGGKKFVVADAAMNDLIRPALYEAHHQIIPVVESFAAMSNVDIVGPVCESADAFAHDRELAPVAAGDLLAILDAGAYGMSLSSNYNTRRRAAEVMVDGETVRLIRRRESYADLFAAEIVQPQSC